MAHLLFIGGSGFFGKSFVDYYKNNSFHKWGIDRLSITSRNKLLKIPDVDCYFYDAHNSSELPDADYIIYAASTTDPYRYKNNAKAEISSQEHMRKNFLKALGDGRKLKKILYTSSGAVYGQTNLNNYRTSELDTNCEPHNNIFEKQIYSSIKLDWERFLIGNFSQNVVIARCFAFIGRHLPLTKHFAIGNFLNDYLNDESIFVKSNYPVYRSYMHSDDLICWLLTILTANSQMSLIYNIGSDHEIELHDLANELQIKNEKKIIKYKFDHSKLDRYVPNTNLAKNEFGLTNRTLEDSLDDIINFYR